ncbi:unnamed protein product [Lathyrus sativus]|nr:unnamed protein product [Lathyrus sativus]
MYSFFFMGFLNSFNVKDMFKFFKEFGLVMEVYIPAQKSKRGKRYRFVRFRKVAYERIIEVKLYNIHIQGKKIYANTPRFQR